MDLNKMIPIKTLGELKGVAKGDSNVLLRKN